MSSAWIDADEAATLLGVRKVTLYAYVSRGLLRSEAGGGDGRARRYSRADVEALLAKKGARQDPERAVQAATDFGAPILDSAITLIEDGRLYYRGWPVERLAREASVEQVAALLWTGERSAAAELFADLPRALPPELALVASAPGLRPIERFAALLPLAGALDPAAWDPRPAAFAATGARILGLMLAAVAGPEGGVAARLASRWGRGVPNAPALFSAALILVADHELNVSSFVARCTASAGATAYHVVSAGLAALQGARHGGHTERVEAWLSGVEGDPAAEVQARLRRGEALPGFGHRLYPEGDPRYTTLIELINESAPEHPALRRALALAAAVEAHLGERPTIDFGLATLGQVLGLPPGAALGLFALGRTLGWVGQALEQRSSDLLIRPRARYVGPAPSTGGAAGGA